MYFHVSHVFDWTFSTSLNSIWCNVRKLHENIVPHRGLASTFPITSTNCYSFGCSSMITFLHFAPIHNIQFLCQHLLAFMFIHSISVCPFLNQFHCLFLFRYIWGGLLVLFGIFLNVYSKNRDKMKLPSIKDLRSWVLTGKKVRFLSQNV